jgi:hypothetical protein
MGVRVRETVVEGRALGRVLGFDGGSWVALVRVRGS